MFFSFEETIRHSRGLILQRGRYREQLEHYFRLFPTSQIRIVLFEEFIRSPIPIARGLCEFLGVDPEKVPTSAQPHSNPGAVPRFLRLHLWRNFLLRELIGRRYVNMLPDMPPARPVHPMHRLAASVFSRINPIVNSDPPKMSDQTREFLTKYYRRANAGLEGLIGKDLKAHWKSA